MTPPSEVYFPSLDECFSGASQLISWKSAFLSVVRPDVNPESRGNLLRFLSCADGANILFNPFNPFPKPSETSKSAFESKTASINATSSRTACNFEEIKSDALWLSNEAQIDEISALRLVILNWQHRREDQLLRHFSEEESTSLQDAIGISRSPHTSYGNQASGILKFATAQTEGLGEPESKDAKQRKLFHLWLSEKKHIIKLTQLLITISLRETSPENRNTTNNGAENGSNTNVSATRFEDIGDMVLGSQDNKDAGSKRGSNIPGCIEAVRLRIIGLEAGSGCFKSDPDALIEQSWLLNSLEELVQIIQILFIQIRLSTKILSSELLLSWLRVMAEYDFLELARPSTEEQTTLFSRLQALISVTTLAFLKLHTSSLLLDKPESYPHGAQETSKENGPYFLSPNDISELNDIFLKTAQVGRLTSSPAVFAWGIIMYSVAEIALSLKEDRELRQAQHAVDSFNNSIQQSSPSHFSEVSIYEEVWEKARNPAFDEDFVRFLVTSAVDRCQLFDLMCTISEQLRSVSNPGEDSLVNQWAQLEFLDLIRSGVQFLDYVPEIVSATLCIISEPKKDLAPEYKTQPHNKYDPRAVFLRDEILMDKFLRNAKSRFPYEAVNFIKFCRALSGCNLVNEDGLPLILQELEVMETYTQVISHGFQGYRPIREDENANYVCLNQPLLMKEVTWGLQPATQSSRELTVLHESSKVPAETVGQVVSESKPAVIMWHHQYNCLGFLGKWLEQSTNTRSNENAPDDEVAADIIGLLADLICSAHALARQNGSESGARRILEMASDGLDRHGDILSVIFDILERSLQSASGGAVGSQDLEITKSCLHFVSALVKVLPGRVWPFLVRSSFLAADGKGGMLAKIAFAVEASSGDLSFLLASIQLFESVVDDAISHAAIRRTTAKVTTASHAVEYTAGVPLHSMRNCLLSFVRAMVEIFNNCTGWRNNDMPQQLRINASLAIAFQKILYYSYGVDDVSDIDVKLTGVFSSSAKYILNILRPQTNDGISFDPILRIILNGFEAHMSTGATSYGLLWTRLLESTINLSKTLIQAGWPSNSPMSTLEKQLFNASPVLVRLYVLNHSYQLPVATLLELLVTRASANVEDEPPSLLGHLGSESSCRFLDALAKFDRPYRSNELNVAIWKLLAAISSKRQQWLAVFLLTGTSPRESLRKTEGDKEVASMKSKPFLETSLDMLSLIDVIPSETAAAALDFVAKAQENWPWVTPELKKHPDFFSKVTNYVASMDMRKVSLYNQCMNTKIAALVADVCTVYLHSAKEARDWNFFKTLIPLVSWFSDNAVEVDGYNASLHANIKRNFEMKYTECKLSDIKRTSLEQPALGQDYFYDVSMGNKLFGYDFAWAGARNQGFVEEVKRANLNLSLVEAQMTLLHSWKFFAIEHCSDFMPDREVQKSMARVVRNCLTSNSRDIPNEPVFSRLLQNRAEFALALLHRLVEAKSKGSEVFSLLDVAWETTHLRNPTYESALVNNDTEYYRLLSNILFLTLQFHVAGSSPVAPEAVSKKPEISSDLSVVLEIVKNVVANGFRSLCTYLHDEPEKCLPKDFAILTAILQTTLKVKDVDRIYEQIAFHLADSDTIRYAATLFSWSYQLTIEGDPIYGEISILYLLELSCIPTIAEQLAVEGILVKLSSYRLTDVFRQAQGCGPFDPIPRLFSIWNAGFLPLCLNLLYHIGRTAPEVSAFLNQFENQLHRASVGFSMGHPTVIHNPFASRLGGNILSDHASSQMSTAGQSTKRISLGMATEACSLALISMIIQKFRDAGPSAGVDPQHIQELKWDKPRVKDDIDALLEKRSILRSRITPTNEKELVWSQREPTNRSNGAESLLEEKIVKELQTAIACMGPSSEDED